MQVGDLVKYRHHGVGVVLDFYRRPGRNQMYTFVNCYWFSLGAKTSVRDVHLRGRVISEKRRSSKNHL